MENKTNQVFFQVIQDHKNPRPFEMSILEVGDRYFFCDMPSTTVDEKTQEDGSVNVFIKTRNGKEITESMGPFSPELLFRISTPKFLEELPQLVI